MSLRTEHRRRSRAAIVVLLSALIAAPSGVSAVAFDPTPGGGPAPARTVDRYAGADRIATAAAIATAAFPRGSSKVYLARSDVLADAVAAGALRGGPILLVPPCGSVPRIVRDTIEDLDPRTVIGLGGATAVCDDLLLEAAGVRAATRLAGDSRIETAVAISRFAFRNGANSVYLARKDVLADAVAAGSLTDGPVLLVPSCGAVPSAVQAEIDRLEPTSVYALGGDVAVCDPLLDAAAAGRDSGRIAGPSRVHTAVAIAEHGFPDRAATVYLARKDGLPDAVAAGALTGGPILLVPSCGELPDEVHREVARLGPSEIVALGGTTAVCDVIVEQSVASWACRATTVERRGAATAGVSLTAAAATATGLHIATRSRTPAAVAEIDRGTGRIADITVLPTGVGSWAAANLGDDVYVGTYSPADLYRVDPAGRATLVASAPDERMFWDLATSPDGRVYAGTYPGGGVFEYNPSNGRTRAWSSLAAGQEYVRSVAANDRTIIAGIGPEAHLVTIDRAGGVRRDLAREHLLGESFVYDVAVIGTRVIAGTWPSGLLLDLDLENPSDVTVHRPRTGPRAAITIITIADGEALFANRTGAIWSYDLDTRLLEELGTPLADEETRLLQVDGDVITGVGGSGAVWTLDRSTGDSEVERLDDLGLAAGPEAPQSLTVAGDRVYVGGHWKVDVHDLVSGEHLVERAPGEPKVLEADGDGLVAALYPDGELWRLDRDGAITDLRIRVGAKQIRPRDLTHDARGDIVLATQAEYGLLGGVLAFINGEPQATVLQDVVPWQGIRSVLMDGDELYLGSEIFGGIGAEPIAREAVIGAFDPVTRHLKWDLRPVPGENAVVGLEMFGDYLVGVTSGGVVFTVDVARREVVWRSWLGRDVWGMTMADGYPHVATTDGLLRVNPFTTVAGTLVEGEARAVAPLPSGCGYAAVVDLELVIGRAEA